MEVEGNRANVMTELNRGLSRLHISTAIHVERRTDHSDVFWCRNHILWGAASLVAPVADISWSRDIYVLHRPSSNSAAKW